MRTDKKIKFTIEVEYNLQDWNQKENQTKWLKSQTDHLDNTLRKCAFDYPSPVHKEGDLAHNWEYPTKIKVKYQATTHKVKK